MQPWKVYVVQGGAGKTGAFAILNSRRACGKGCNRTNTHGPPDQFFEPYCRSRRAVGFALYGASRHRPGAMSTSMRAQHDRNFVFFDAPVGMIFTIDRRLNQGSWIDYGMFLQNIMIAARAQGPAHLPAGRLRALSPADPAGSRHSGRGDRTCVAWRLATRINPEPENALRTDRAPLEEWVKFFEVIAPADCFRAAGRPDARRLRAVRDRLRRSAHSRRTVDPVRVRTSPLFANRKPVSALSMLRPAISVMRLPCRSSYMNNAPGAPAKETSRPPTSEKPSAEVRLP